MGASRPPFRIVAQRSVTGHRGKFTPDNASVVVFQHKATGKYQIFLLHRPNPQLRGEITPLSGTLDFPDDAAAVAEFLKSYAKTWNATFGEAKITLPDPNER